METACLEHYTALLKYLQELIKKKKKLLPFSHAVSLQEKQHAKGQVRSKNRYVGCFPVFHTPCEHLILHFYSSDSAARNIHSKNGQTRAPWLTT